MYFIQYTQICFFTPLVNISKKNPTFAILLTGQLIFMDLTYLRNRILFLFLFLLCFVPSIKADVYLVSVGISDYPGTSSDLSLPAKDAQAISSLYKTNNKAHVSLLLNERATKDAIIQQMKTLFSKAGKDDIVVLFFSGHGAPGAFCAYDGSLMYSDIRKAMSGTKCTNKMIFADACFSGKIRENKRSGQNNKMNIMLFLSSRSDEVSIESPSMNNGYFTSCLLRCLKGGSDSNRDKVITARELFTGVRDGVIELSNDRQHPVMWGNFRDDMPVMRW